MNAALPLLCITWILAGAQDDWAQWGGPRRDFRVAEQPLARSWPAEGPPVLWSRELGGGQGGLAVSGSMLFTLVRQGSEEIGLSIDCVTGETRWRAAESVAELDLAYGMGPFSTPLVDDERVYFLGATGILRAHRCGDGGRVWRRELEREFPGPRSDRGYAPSPILVAGNLIVPIGAPGAAVVAFDPADGRVRWRRHDYGSDYASPICVRVSGALHLVCHLQEEVIGLDPATGDLLWQIPSRSDRTQHVIAPLDLGGGDVLVSTTYGVERLKLAANPPTVLWKSRRVTAQVGNLLFLPRRRLVLGASSAYTGSPLVALDARSGETLWRERGIDCGFLWSVGESLLAFASDGVLVHARATRDGLEVLDRHRIFEGEKLWSAPAMRGTTLFVKDREKILALDLGE